MLTSRQAQLLTFIIRQIDASGVSPSVRECAKHLKSKSLGTVHGLLSGLEDRGFIRRAIPDPTRRRQQSKRAIEILRRLSPWLPIATLPAATGYVWLFNSTSKILAGPHKPVASDGLRFDYWAPCEPPSPFPESTEVKQPEDPDAP